MIAAKTGTTRQAKNNLGVLFEYKGRTFSAVALGVEKEYTGRAHGRLCAAIENTWGNIVHTAETGGFILPPAPARRMQDNYASSASDIKKIAKK